MFGSTVLVPYLTGLDPGSALVASGVGTLLFHVLTGGKVPAYLGSSFAFIAPLAYFVSKQHSPGAATTGLLAVAVVYGLMALLVRAFGFERLRRIIPPVVVGEGPVQEVVHRGADLEQSGGFLEFPIPISTPGYDNAPYLSSAHFITKDPDTGIRNVGNYRGQIKSARTCGVYFSPHGNDAMEHWKAMRKRGQALPVAIVVGAPPVVSYVSVQRMAIDLDELAVAGGLAEEPIRLVKCQTVDLEVPADAEVVIEGYIRTDVVEPEGPFGESHGFVHPRSESPIVEITCV
ncbi:MAG: UbiD family decarboxylase, partial [Alicyclobacillus sp.]|nr:UbiD family decarboxylase [Alicyclobacillus sp.]